MWGGGGGSAEYPCIVLVIEELPLLGRGVGRAECSCIVLVGESLPLLGGGGGGRIFMYFASQ